MNNSNDIIDENRTRDLPACSAVPQPPAPPVPLGKLHIFIKSTIKIKVNFTLKQATKAQRWNRGIPLLFL